MCGGEISKFFPPVKDEPPGLEKNRVKNPVKLAEFGEESGQNRGRSATVVPAYNMTLY